MIGELIFGIITGLCSIVFLIYSVILLLDDEISFGVGVLFFSIVISVLCVIVICDYSKATKQGGYTHQIEDVKTVQIDTVVTTYNQISDTTYVIKYLK